jgi:hypothetical protein
VGDSVTLDVPKTADWVSSLLRLATVTQSFINEGAVSFVGTD